MPVRSPKRPRRAVTVFNDLPRLTRDGFVLVVAGGLMDTAYHLTPAGRGLLEWTGLIGHLLVALGHDPGSEHLVETPRRVARSYAELLTPRNFNLTTFPNDEGYDELVLARGIPFQSWWESMTPTPGVPLSWEASCAALVPNSTST